MLIRHGFSFFGHGKVTESHCRKRVGTLVLPTFNVLPVDILQSGCSVV